MEQTPASAPQAGTPLLPPRPHSRLRGKCVKGKSAAAVEKEVRSKQRKKKKQKEEEYAIVSQGLKERNNKLVVVVPKAKRARGSSRSAVAAAVVMKDKPGERYHEDDTYAIFDQALHEHNKLVFLRGTRFSFGLEDLLRASAKVLGKGTAEIAYKAILNDSTGSTIFVKRLKDATSRRKHFQMHIEIMGDLKHPNIMPLHAYFFSKEEKLLVYDYYSLGSLSSHLHEKGVRLCNSSKTMRAEGGYGLIKEAIEKLGLRHKERMAHYGTGNEKCLTGQHETTDMNVFSWGVGNRGVYVHVGGDIEKEGKGLISTTIMYPGPYRNTNIELKVCHSGNKFMPIRLAMHGNSIGGGYGICRIPYHVSLFCPSMCVVFKNF